MNTFAFYTVHKMTTKALLAVLMAIWIIQHMACTTDIVDLIYSLLELPEETDFSEAEEILYERYGIDYENFEDLILDLIEYTPIVRTAITNTKVHAFIDFKSDPNLILVKKCVDKK